MNDLRIEVTEPTLVRDPDGKPVGRLQPGRSYRIHSIDGDRVTLKGPDGSVGAVPRSAVTLSVTPPAATPAGSEDADASEDAAAPEATKSAGPSASPIQPDPTRRQLRKKARRQRKQDKRSTRSQVQRELSGATSNPSKVKVSKGGIIVALGVLVLLAGAGAIAVLVSTRGQTIEPGWWQHTADEEVGEGDPALDLVLLIDEEEQIERGEARYDDGEFCFVAVFADAGADPDGGAISTTGYGHFCDEGTLIEIEIPDLALSGGLLEGEFMTYAVVEGERSILITEGQVVLEQRGAPDGADRMARPSTWAPTSAEGQPARVARVLNPEVAGESTTGYIEVILCPFGRLRYWQDLQQDGERVVAAGAGQIDSDLEGTLLVSRATPGEPSTGESWIVVVDDENVNLFAPEGAIVVPITNDTTRRCGI